MIRVLLGWESISVRTNESWARVGGVGLDPPRDGPGNANPTRGCERNYHMGMEVKRTKNDTVNSDFDHPVP